MATANTNSAQAQAPQASQAPETPDNGPKPSDTPAVDKPGSPPVTNPADNPSAPPNGTPEGPFPGQAGLTEEALSAFNETDPGAHMRSLLGEDGPLAGVDPTSVGLSADPNSPQPKGQTQQPGANGQVNPALNGQPAGQPQVAATEPNPLLQRLMMGQMQPTGQPAGGLWPQQQAQFQPQGQPAPQAQPQGQPSDAQWVPYSEPVALPPAIVAALDSDDANTRVQAIQATLAAFGNHVAAQMERRIAEYHLPRAAQNITANVMQTSQVQRVQSDLFGSFPQLRFASPALVQQAAMTVIQDEMSRNPYATYTPEIGRKIGELAMQALATLGGGQQPHMQPAPQAQVQMQPQAQPQGQYPNAQPAYVQLPNGQFAQVIPQLPQQLPVQPNGQPYMAPTGAGGFGPQFAPAVTPESEWASFQGGGW